VPESYRTLMYDEERYSSTLYIRVPLSIGSGLCSFLHVDFAEFNFEKLSEKGLGATLRAWIRAVYGRSNGPKGPLLASHRPTSWAYPRLFGQFLPEGR
jgi:hypothetical protein